MIDLIFVYGSLMSTVPSAASSWLQQQARLVGEDQVRGYLYDLGQYPGIIIDDSSPDLVKGEVYQLYQVDTGLSYLDAYEGTEITRPEYERIQCATTAGRLCWVYQFLWTGPSYSLITSGDYCTYYPTNPHHLAFINRIDASVQNED